MRRLLVVAVLLPACWTWSFPETLPDEADAGLDDAGGQAGQDGTPDGGLDVGAPGGLGGGNGGSGGAPRGCESHDKCASGLCTLAGTCAPEDEVSYVANACAPTATGTRESPFCSLAAGLASMRRYVRVSQGTFEAAPIVSSGQVYGLPGATIRATACDTLAIQNADVVLVGFSIEGNIMVSGNRAKATLVGNRIGPSSCTGVRTSDAASLVMDRNFVHGHAKGGVWTETEVLLNLTNNIIVGNGAMNSEVGGAQLAAAVDSRFMHNTVFNNRGRNQRSGGVECLGPLPLPVINSIIWGNSSKELSDGCSARFSLLADPLFTGGPPGEPTSYQLGKGSPAIDKGTVGGPAYDFFGAMRKGAPDQGAVEFLPPP